MTFSKSQTHKLNKAMEIYSQLTAEKYKEMQNPDVHFSLDFERRMEKLINRNKKPYFRLINTAAKRVAIIIAVIIIALTGTVLSVDALREGVKNFVIETFEKFSVLSFDKNSVIPKEIEECFAPTYTPSGFKIIEAENSEGSNFILYKDDNGSSIYYTQLVVDGALSYIDTQDAVTEEIGKYLFVRKEQINRSAIYFSDEEYSYEIVAFGNLSKEELLKIAESVK